MLCITLSATILDMRKTAALLASFMFVFAVRVPLPVSAQTAKVKSHHKSRTQFPKVASAHFVLDSVQAKQSGNEHVKQCGQNGPNETCWDPSLRHITNRIYGVSKERCEHDEGVTCEELQPCVVDKHMTYKQCQQWVPIGKPVFEDKTPEEPNDLVVGAFLASTPLMFQADPHGCNYSFTWDEGKGLCSINIVFSDAGMGVITCSPVANQGNTQNMVCWYKPTKPTEPAK